MFETMPADSIKTVVITGGTGILGSSMVGALLKAGMQVILIGRNKEKIDHSIRYYSDYKDKITGFLADVTDRVSLEKAMFLIDQKYPKIDILINAAGGNVKGAVIAPDADFFDMDMHAFDEVVRLNLYGTVLPVLVFGKKMAQQGKGCIINISSVAASKPLTRVVGYASAKASIENFTRWLAVELSTKYSPHIRVNAIAPGFFLTEQNKTLLMDENGAYTERAKSILQHTPMNRLGQPEDLHSTLLWLCDDASSFVTGIVVPVDGGFNAFSGV